MTTVSLFEALFGKENVFLSGYDQTKSPDSILVVRTHREAVLSLFGSSPGTVLIFVHIRYYPKAASFEIGSFRSRF